MYRKIVQNSPLQIAESQVRYTALTERHLQVVWLEQSLFKQLKTEDGQPITVLSPGIWNHEAGPDFLHAHLRIGKKELRGDIELHLRDELWKSHHHHTDPRYNKVILHLSLWKPPRHYPIVTEAGTKLPKTYIEEAFLVPIEKIPHLIDLDLYPYCRHAGSGRCCDTVFEEFSTAERTDFFMSAAKWRLEVKAKRLRQGALTPEHALAFGLAQALGYRHNATAFGHLYNSYVDTDPHNLFATLLSSCQFFTPKYYLRWKECSYFQELYATSCQPCCHVNLRLDGIRPLNHPVRRLAYLSQLIQETESLEKKVVETWQKHRTHQKPSFLFNKLINVIPSYNQEFWEKHLLFGIPQKTKTQLVGKSLRKEMLLNVLFPILFEQVTSFEQEQLLQLYAHLTPNLSGKTNYLEQRLFGNRSTLSSAIEQQGAFQLHADFCSRFESSCYGCPFPERVQIHNSLCQI